MKKIFSCVILMLIFGVSVNALDVKVVREANDEIHIGDVLDVNISVYSDNDIEFMIKEEYDDNVEFIDPVKANEINYNGIKHYRLEWKDSVENGKVKIFNYKIKPLELGEFEIVPTEVFVGNKSYSSDVLSVFVECKNNGICDKGENYLNCKEDCLNGANDGVCDDKVDGICDLDCSRDVDCNYEDEKSFFDKVFEFFKNLL